MHHSRKLLCTLPQMQVTPATGLPPVSNRRQSSLGAGPPRSPSPTCGSLPPTDLPRVDHRRCPRGTAHQTSAATSARRSLPGPSRHATSTLGADPPPPPPVRPSCAVVISHMLSCWTCTALAILARQASPCSSPHSGSCARAQLSGALTSLSLVRYAVCSPPLLYGRHRCSPLHRKSWTPCGRSPRDDPDSRNNVDNDSRGRPYGRLKNS
jgi:hypothetical protein